MPPRRSTISFGRGRGFGHGLGHTATSHEDPLPTPAPIGSHDDLSYVDDNEVPITEGHHTVAEPTRGHTGNTGVKPEDPTPRSALLERERKLESLVSGAQNYNNNNAILKQVCKPKPFTNTQVIGSYPTRQNQGQFHDSLNIPLRSNPRNTRGRTYDSLDISKHNLINIRLITHPTKPRSISRLTRGL
ncbi:hypothetical protein GQ457_03G021960 [Hibiscus cannabinus]